MKKLCFFLLFLCFQVGLFANSLQLFNDSPYTLNATVFGADGSTLGQFTIRPRAQSAWSDDSYQSGTYGTPSSSLVPYTVQWYCPEGTPYAICTNQSPGSLVTAQSGQGNMMCKSQKKKEYIPSE